MTPGIGSTVIYRSKIDNGPGNDVLSPAVVIRTRATTVPEVIDRWGPEPRTVASASDPSGTHKTAPRPPGFVAELPDNETVDLVVFGLGQSFREYAVSRGDGLGEWEWPVSERQRSTIVCGAGTEPWSEMVDAVSEPVGMGTGPVFNRGHLPDGDWKSYRKTATTRMRRMPGAFTVQTSSEGLVRCEDGWLAVDSAGFPYPITASEHDAIYELVDDEVYYGQAGRGRVLPEGGNVG